MDDEKLICIDDYKVIYCFKCKPDPKTKEQVLCEPCHKTEFIGTVINFDETFTEN